MHKIFLSLGSNVWEKQTNINKTIKLLESEISNIKKSKIYKTKAFWEINQDDFLNMVLVWGTNLSPKKLLDFIKEVEQRIWRINTYRWWPRVIDIDILFYDEIILETQNLTIPHIWIIERDFVLKPLLDLNEDFIHPVNKKTIKKMFMELCKNNLTII